MRITSDIFKKPAKKPVQTKPVADKPKAAPPKDERPSPPQTETDRLIQEESRRQARQEESRRQARQEKFLKKRAEGKAKRSKAADEKRNLALEAAPKRIESLGDLAAQRVSIINSRLFEIKQALMDVQPKAHGSITLAPQTCSKPNCTGCPHPRWFISVDPSKKSRYTSKAAPAAERKKTVGRAGFFEVEIKYPLKRINKTGKFADCHEEVTALIKEAKQLIDIREKIIKQVASLAMSLGKGVRVEDMYADPAKK